MPDEVKAIMKKSLMSGLVLITASAAVTVAAFAGLIKPGTANAIILILVSATVGFNTLVIPIAMRNKKK